MTVHDEDEARQLTSLRDELVEVLQRRHPTTSRFVLLGAANRALAAIVADQPGTEPATYSGTAATSYVSVRITATYRAADGSLPEALDVVWDNGNPPDGEALAGVIAALAQVPAGRHEPPPGDPSLRLVAD